MPDFDDWTQELIESVGLLPCEVEIPAEWGDYFSRTGMMGSGPGDKRRYPRGYFRDVAALEHRQSFPALQRVKAWHAIYTKDVSRCGLSFLHSEQLFPGEKLRCLMRGKILHTIEVARCRRVQPRCFDIGANFLVET